MIKKVISGGQTGVDRMGLEVARSLGIPTGGMAPKDYWTEEGPDVSLKAFGLTEDLVRGYMPRTIHNIHNSDGTVVFGDPNSPGSRNTWSFCKVQQKPFIVNPSAAELIAFINDYKIETLNVAGNRMSKLGVEKLKFYIDILTEALSQTK